MAEMSEGRAVLIAQHQGWYVDQDLEESFCPRHRSQHGHAAAAWTEVGLEGEEDPDPVPPPVGATAVVQRVEVVPPILGWLIVVLMLATFGLGLLAFVEYTKRKSVEVTLTSVNKDLFEQRSSIQMLSCTSLFDTPRRCSGRMTTGDKPAVPVRYVCGAEDCRFEK
jgi:hypothetical protein